MLSYQKGIVKTSVRHLVEFLLRTGSITTGSALSANPEVYSCIRGTGRWN